MIIFAGIFGLFREENIFENIKSKLTYKGYNNFMEIKKNNLKVIIFSPQSLKSDNCFCNDNLAYVIDRNIYGTNDLQKYSTFDLWRLYGNDFLKGIGGGFSLFIADIEKNEILLSRDIFGIKNLYYHCCNNYIVFSNDLNTLKEFKNNFSLSINPQSLYDYTALFVIPSPNTFYSEINSLLPGEYIYCKFSGIEMIETQKKNYYYWKIEGDLIESQKKCVELAEELVNRSIEKYLKKSNIYSSLLSGGIDSSLISYYAENYLDTDLFTFNVKFLDSKYDETWAALEAAQTIGSKHFTYNIRKEDITLDNLLKILEIPGQPFGDSSLIPTFYVLNMAKNYSDNILTGEGGDEAFWLNPNIIYYVYYKSLPYSLRKIIFYFTKNLNILKHSANINDFESSIKFFKYLYSWIREKEHNKLIIGNNYLPIDRYYEPQWVYSEECKIYWKQYISHNAMEVLTRINLPNDYLLKLEVAGKSLGLNIISPFLDEEIYKFSLKIPFYYKKNKILLRKIAEKYFSKKITRKQKWGFGIPLNYYFKRDEREKTRDFIYSKLPKLSDYFQKELLVSWVEHFYNEKIPPGISSMGLYQRIYMLLSLCLFI